MPILILVPTTGNDRMSFFVIRQAQMAEFERLARVATVRRAAVHLERHFPKEWGRLPYAGRHALLDHCVGTAARLGAGKHDALRFATLALLHGEDFTTREWVLDVLDDAAIAPADRLAHLHAEALRRAAKQAASAGAREAFERD
ncbi:hypothetical protein HH212_18615 [Massilia forsythiae]|uniref:Uncharacterized protein n=1 Tax=Massilia forsythiae TaxID=2728020 RepID=A0A7Z2VZL1_9BURK|nr:hypothetical protein [Massilia forsythiae]QJE01792.1 hypothetical protein HH212_18615 [Massilia forsythiae]